ncbi:MAG: hypothetical protein KAU90_12430, partial [Sulfurovaceae bacterium]|nr:hypothetical protein [Sulfurovaceae bacterium]
ENKLVAPEVQIQSDTVFIKYSNKIRNNLVRWEKNYILNLGHQNYNKNNDDKTSKRYDTIEAYVKDAPKRRYTAVQYVGEDKMLLDTSEELDVMEKVIDGDTDGDFENLKDHRDSNQTIEEKAVKALVKHLNQKLTGGLLTPEQEKAIAENLDIEYNIFEKYHRNATVDVTGYEDTSKYNKKRQLLNGVIFPIIRAVVTSSVYMTE